jgi:GT2 family glycosyltransferase
MPSNYTITFACYNQLDYTQQFIASLDREEVDFSRIVAVDNGSTDGTREWLQTQGFGQVILNNRNLGCGAAWNQGALAIQSEWTVVMNNDVVCAKGWLKGLLGAAEQHQLKIVSPAMVEGELDYDFPAFVADAHKRMQGYCREKVPHAVCLMVHQDVWDEIGYFMPIPRLLGYEDAVFFQRASEAGLRMGTSADSWLHHFGSITQKGIKLEKKMNERDSLGNRNLMKFYMNQSWLMRKKSIAYKKRLVRQGKTKELATFGLTVHSWREQATFHWY